MLSWSRQHTFAVLAGLIAGVALAVLYVIHAGPVHALARPPAELAALKASDKPMAVPEVAFVDAAGKRHMLAEFRGRYVLLNLWATWCAPCVKELPALAQLGQAVSPDRLSVVAVNVGRSSMAETAQFLKTHRAGTLAPYADSNIALMRAFGAFGLPMTVLIDPQGREVARALGAAEWDAPASVSYFKSLAAHAAS
jgi:thiol-disulfide isomerase/thioredoxin